MSRLRALQQPPPPGFRLGAFPTASLNRRRVLARAHRADREVHWFSSDLGGRFDLKAPAGTWYAADDLDTALRESFGEILTAGRAVPVLVAVARAVTMIRGASGRFAAVSEPAAATFGITAELTSMTPYSIPQAWAATFREGGFAGVRYGCRLTPGPAKAWAVFGEAGLHAFGEIVEVVPGVEACRRAGVPLISEPPGLGEISRLRGAE